MTVQDTAATTTGATRRQPAAILQLESGDRLTRLEFERRYQAMPHVKKAELIEGVVYVGSAVRARSHSQPHGLITGWLLVYSAATPGVALHDNPTVRLDLDNEPQPDDLLRIETEFGGRSRVSDDDYIEGPPELIVEVAASSASYDLHDKLRAYRRNGVQEYVVWRVLNNAVDWFRLEDGDYVRVQPDADGIIRSEVFPGLWLSVPALLAGDSSAVLEKLQEGIAAPEHAQFVERLQAVRERRRDAEPPGTSRSGR